MKVHVLQHVRFEGLGAIRPWLTRRNATVSTTLLHESIDLPAPDGVDLVIALGGPMSVNDEATLPWLIDEKRFIREAIQAGTPVLGICLGAQLIASAFGATVRANTHAEIGWFDIEATPSPPATYQFPQRLCVFHWHGETFDLPPGATRLASSAACANQAFQLGSNVLGVQFHLETTADSASALLAKFRDELVEAPFIQSEAAIRNVSTAVYENANHVMADVLDYLTRT